MGKADIATRKQLELILLHGYSKAATVQTEAADHLGIQTTPFMHQDFRYHRSTTNILLEKLADIFAEDMQIAPHELIPIDSPLMSEVFARELPQPGLNLNIESKQAFKDLVDNLLSRAASGQFPTQRVFIDFSKYLENHPTAPKEIKQEIVHEFEDIMMEKIRDFLQKNPSVKSEDISNQLLSMLHLVAFTEHKGQNLLLMPEFLLEPRYDADLNRLIGRRHVQNRHGEAYRLFDKMMQRTGYRVGPGLAKAAMLRLKDAKTLLGIQDLPVARLATKGDKIPKVCQNFQEFMQMPVVSKFRKLPRGDPRAPYLKVMPEATWLLLDGLNQYKGGGGIHQNFVNKGIEELLQLSYFRMMNAINEAIFRRDDQIAFQNQVELIIKKSKQFLQSTDPMTTKL